MSLAAPANEAIKYLYAFLNAVPYGKRSAGCFGSTMIYF